jgi:hypothetical protein
MSIRRSIAYVIAVVLSVLEPIFSYGRQTAPGVVCALGDCDLYFLLDLLPFLLFSFLLGLALRTDGPVARGDRWLGTLATGGAASVTQALLVTSGTPVGGDLGSALLGSPIVILLGIGVAYLMVATGSLLMGRLGRLSMRAHTDAGSASR